MKLTQLLLDELDREAPRTRRALEHVPLGRDDWKPHPKSMPLGRLAGLVASMPSWVTLIIEQDELDLNPPAGGGQYQQPSTEKLGETLDLYNTPTIFINGVKLLGDRPIEEYRALIDRELKAAGPGGKKR